MLFKRVVALLAMCFGFLGGIVCILGIYGVWTVGSRLDRANDRVFAAVDQGLASGRDRVLGVQQRVQESRLATDEIGKHVRAWTAKQAAERIVSRLEIEGQADKLVQKLQQAALGLDAAQESIRRAQQLLETANSIGAPVDTAWVEEVLGKLTWLRSTLHQAEATAEVMRASLAKLDDGASPEERNARVVRLVARVIAAIGEIDTRLGEAALRLSELQASAGQLQVRTSNYIVRATGAGCLLFAWMGAGQATLCLYGWKTWGRRCEGVKASGSAPSVAPAG